MIAEEEWEQLIKESVQKCDDMIATMKLFMETIQTAMDNTDWNKKERIEPE